jgi:DNA-binding NarL/FixJ family response regulator
VDRVGGRWHDRSVTTILVVDDHAPFRAQARALLEADGFVVVGEAEDGASGLTAARTLRPDLVLVDIGLPDMDGFEVACELADREPDLPVILVSTREAADYGSRLACSRALGFIPKDELSGSAILALTDPR